MSNHAIILAGGKGTRLKPFTTNFPKPLVPLGDMPILEIVIRQLRKNNFKKITISTGHLAELIEAYFGNGSRWGVSINYVREYKPLNTAGALKLVNFINDDVLVMNGDILTALNYLELFKLHKKSKALATISLKKRNVQIDFGVLHVDKSGFLKKYEEKPTHDFSVSMGIYVLNKRCKDYIKKNESIGMPDLFRRLMSDGKKIYCHNSRAFWLDIGRVDDYERAQEIFESTKNKLL